MTLIAVGLAWVAGLLAVGAFGAPWWMGAAWLLALAPAVVTLAPGRRAFGLLGACVAAAGCAGWLLGPATQYDGPEWTQLAGSEVRLTGKVASEPDIGDTTAAYVVEVESIEWPDGNTSGGGRVLVYLNQYARHLPGDRLVLAGELELPPTFDSFDYRAFLARRGIAATMFRPRIEDAGSGNWSPRRELTGLRLSLDRSLRRSLPEPEASLAAGIAFGREDALPRETLEQYNRAGLRHMVAVSGSNVILVAAIAEYFAVRLFGRRWAWIPAALFVGVYLAAAGLSPSVVRSGVMAAVLLFGGAIGRPQSGLPALAAAVIAMTAISPELALDPGFQLSATATAGIITLSPWMTHGFLRVTRWRVFAPPRWVCDTAALTLSASVATLPVMWATFGEVSLVSPVANLAAAPAFAAAFGASLVTAGLGLWSRDAGELAGLGAYYPLAFLGWIADWFGSAPFASRGIGHAGAELAVVAYLPIGALAAAAYRFRPESTEAHPITNQRGTNRRILLAGATGAVALAIIPVSCTPRGGPGVLQVDFLDVGQGDAALITTPHGHQVLIDGGPSGTRLARELGAVMPHWDRTLDAVLLSHPQEDHVGGLPEALERLRVIDVYDDGHTNATFTVMEYERRAPLRRALTAGDSVELDGVRFEVFSPSAGSKTDDLNDLSLVVRITYGDQTVLFTGDAGMPALEPLVAAGDARGDVLKVPHHGSRTTDPAFFAAASPSVAVISVGAGNLFGHPYPATLDALAAAKVFRTDLDGRIRVTSDGHRLTVTTER